MSHGETIKQTEKVGKWGRIMIKKSISKGKIYAFIYIYIYIYRFIRIYIFKGEGHMEFFRKNIYWGVNFFAIFSTGLK